MGIKEQFINLFKKKTRYNSKQYSDKYIKCAICGKGGGTMVKSLDDNEYAHVHCIKEGQ